MLRAAGLPADVALLQSGVGTDVDADLPNMGRFDHAIVYVGANPPLWIDATAGHTRVGMLPSGDQGRFALLASAASTALVKTPEAEPKDAWERLPALFVVKENGGYKLLVGGPGGTEGMGYLVLELLEQKNIKAAHWWLDQLVDVALAGTEPAVPPPSASGPAPRPSCAPLPPYGSAPPA